MPGPAGERPDPEVQRQVIRTGHRVRLVKTILMVALVCVCVCGGNVCKILGIDAEPMLGVSTIVILAAAMLIWPSLTGCSSTPA